MSPSPADATRAELVGAVRGAVSLEPRRRVRVRGDAAPRSRRRRGRHRARVRARVPPAADVRSPARARNGRGCSGSRATRRSTSCAGAVGWRRWSTDPDGSVRRAGRRRRRCRAAPDRGARGARIADRARAGDRRAEVPRRAINAELARVLGVSESNAGTMLHRTMEKLRKACDATADDDLIDPEIAAALDAIDATLAGEPVDPRHAELAELALLLVATRPQPQAEFVSSLDSRVHSRFARVDEAKPQGCARRLPAVVRARWRGWPPPLAAAAVVVVALNSGGSQLASRRPAPAASSSSAGAASTSAASGGAAPDRHAGHSARRGQAGDVGAAASTATSSAAVPNSGKVIAAPLPNGRKIVQSAQLALSTPASHIDDVAQEVFRVIGDENGVVNSSTVTASASGYAQFQLSVPSSALQATMTSLSELKYADGQLADRRHPGRQRPVPVRPAPADRRPGAPHLAAQAARRTRPRRRRSTA